MKRVWNKDMDDILRKHYPEGRLWSLAQYLGVTECAVRARAKAIGVRRKTHQHHPWTCRQISYLKNHYADTPMEILVEKTKHKVYSVYNKAGSLGLKRSDEYRRSQGYILAEHPKSVATRFKKGSVPPNKGKNEDQFRSPEANERCKATQFKKGHTPANAKPVGYERVCKEDGYVYIKVDGVNKMVLKHRWLWEQANGPIPKGYNITFKDGNRQNCELSNLVLMSRADCARKRSQDETPEQRKARIEKLLVTRNETIRKDRMRIHWGLEPKTKLIKRW